MSRPWHMSLEIQALVWDRHTKMSRPWHMTLEIQALAWDRHTKMSRPWHDIRNPGPGLGQAHINEYIFCLLHRFYTFVLVLTRDWTFYQWNISFIVIYHPLIFTVKAYKRWNIIPNHIYFIPSLNLQNGHDHSILYILFYYY